MPCGKRAVANCADCGTSRDSLEAWWTLLQFYYVSSVNSLRSAHCFAVWCRRRTRCNRRGFGGLELRKFPFAEYFAASTSLGAWCRSLNCDRPQQIIIKQLVEKADILMAVLLDSPRYAYQRSTIWYGWRNRILSGSRQTCSSLFLRGWHSPQSRSRATPTSARV